VGTFFQLAQRRHCRYGAFRYVLDGHLGGDRLRPRDDRQDSETGAGLNFRWRNLKSKKIAADAARIQRLPCPRGPARRIGNFLSAAIPRRKIVASGKATGSDLDEFILPFLPRQEGVDRRFWSWFPVEDARHCAEDVAAIRLGEPPPLCSRAT